MKRFHVSSLAAAALALSLSACGGGGSSDSAQGPTPSPTPPPAPTPAGTNQVPIRVEQYARVSLNAPNIPYVTVTICDAGGNCQDIDHVVLDTGSTGLRLLASEVSIALPGITGSGGGVNGQLTACQRFLDGSFLFGAVRRATVKMGGATATSIPIQLVGDNAVPTTVSRCGAADDSAGTLGELFGRGILGVGLSVDDASFGTYYVCSGTNSATCGSQITPGATQRLINPITAFPSDNNGLIVTMDAVSSQGQAGANGVLTFGVGTQANNSPSGFTVLTARSDGNITSVLTGTTFSTTFFDTGSNFYYLDATGVPIDAKGTYIPSTLTTLPIRLTGANGTSFSTQVQLINPSNLSSSVRAINNVGYDSALFSSTPYVDLGMPYFYGKSVGQVIEGAASSAGTGPLFMVRQN